MESLLSSNPHFRNELWNYVADNQTSSWRNTEPDLHNEHLLSQNAISFRNTPQQIAAERDTLGIKLTDAAVLSVLLPFTIPIIGVATLATIVEKPTQSPFFCHQRIAPGGEITHVWKIRTMGPTPKGWTEGDSDLARKTGNDIRVTHVGKALRKGEVDEAPQVITTLIDTLRSIITNTPRTMQLAGDYRSMSPSTFTELNKLANERINHDPLDSEGLKIRKYLSNYEQHTPCLVPSCAAKRFDNNGLKSNSDRYNNMRATDAELTPGERIVLLGKMGLSMMRMIARKIDISQKTYQNAFDNIVVDPDSIPGD